MITYLLKVTLIWALFLVLYELLYKKSSSFTLNRLYLLLALVAGLLLPFVPLPFETTGANQGFDQINYNLQNIGQATAPAVQQASAAPSGPGIATILLWIYLAGVLVFLLLSLREVVLILRTAIYGHYTTVGPYRIFSSSRLHAPFSFMGWVFISDPLLYDEQGLEFIFKHEEAHNRRWHWLDTILMQLFFIVFWFHPLIWRYRYLLKLNHEYEADRQAAAEDAYGYGHFLLQQTLLKGTPAIAHSFHFSPIKNRISMLTQNGKKSGWKYALTIPLLLGCVVLFARSNTNNERIRVGNKTTYKGHQFEWGMNMTDSIWIQDPESGENRVVTAQREGGIQRMDGDSVFSNDNPSVTQAQCRYNDKSMYEYAAELFSKKFPALPDSILSIAVRNLVVDEKGVLSYYDLEVTTKRSSYDAFRSNSPYAAYTKEVEKIIAAAPEWLPGLHNGKKVKVYMNGFNLYFKPMTGKIAPGIK